MEYTWYQMQKNRLNTFQFKYIGKYDEILFIYFLDPQADPLFYLGMVAP